jgi:alpha/beta superfamily hydrolase
VTLQDIRANTELPAVREDITLHTADGQTLVGELATPVGPVTSTLITLHPLPTHGGFMDSHILRKAANRLPALIGTAVLRFNTRGTESPRGRSSGAFDGGVAEEFDLRAAVEFVAARGLPKPWLLGWSFGTELALKYGPDHDIAGAILLSPPLRRATAQDLHRWVECGRPLIALVPEHDEFLKPAEAREKFATVGHAEVIAGEDQKHLWVGEVGTRMVLDWVAQRLAPGSSPLPTQFDF